ncbi:MAG: LON peptidase substrate-binding domain-containing protein [Actinomycetota bacterium]|nr:LON peptidase substrate-binding domain-containing protein [Actinomycetota bacterium]
MPDDVPMFPLGTVLLPGAYLPLHVFEPRYRALVQACLEGEGEFGVVLIERGSEVGGGDTRFASGCIAKIVEAVQLEDGRYAIGTIGVRRIRILRWLPDAPYPRAEVEDWPDPPPGPGAGEAVGAVAATLRRVLALASELGEAVAPATVALGDDPLLAGYAMSAVAPVGPLDALALLAAPSHDARLELLAQLLEETASVLATRLAGG